MCTLLLDRTISMLSLIVWIFCMLANTYKSLASACIRQRTMSSGEYLADMELRKAFGGREKLEWLSQWNNNYRNQRVILENIPIRYSHIFDNITSNKNSSLTKIYDTRTNILFHACLFDSLLQFTNCNFTNKNENIMCYITTPGSSLNISLTNWKYYNFIFNNNVRTTDLLTEFNNNNNFVGNFIHIKKHYTHKSQSIYPSVAPSAASRSTTHPQSISSPSILPTKPPSIPLSTVHSNALSIFPTQPPPNTPSILPTQSSPIDPTQPPSMISSVPTPSQLPPITSSISSTHPPSLAPSIIPLAPTQAPLKSPPQPTSITPRIAPSLAHISTFCSSYTITCSIIISSYSTTFDSFVYCTIIIILILTIIKEY
eukprot:390866_1